GKDDEFHIRLTQKPNNIFLNFRLQLSFEPPGTHEETWNVVIPRKTQNARIFDVRQNDPGFSIQPPVNELFHLRCIASISFVVDLPGTRGRIRIVAPTSFSAATSPASRLASV